MYPEKNNRQEKSRKVEKEHIYWRAVITPMRQIVPAATAPMKMGLPLVHMAKENPSGEQMISPEWQDH